MDLYLLNPPLADALAQLPWVADGITSLDASYAERLQRMADIRQTWQLEPLTFEALLSLAQKDPAMVRMLISYPWLTDGVTEPEEQAIQSFAAIADVDSAAFARVVAGLSWVSDGVRFTEQRALQALLRLRAADPSTAQRVRTFPWVLDGVTLVDLRAIQSFAVAAEGDARTFTRLVADLPWVLDGVTITEHRAIEALFGLGAIDHETAQFVFALPWLENGPNWNEMTILETLLGLAEKDSATAGFTASFPWLADGGTPIERDALSILLQIAEMDASTAPPIAALPWLADDVGAAELAGLRSLLRLVAIDPPTAQLLVALPWMLDEVSSMEIETIHHVVTLTEVDPATARLLVVLPWMTDEVSGREIQTIHILVALTEVDPATAQMVTTVPWLDNDMLPAEEGALRFLVRLAETDKEATRLVATFPWVIDGVSDDELWTLYVVVELTEAGWTVAQMEDALPWVVEGANAEEQAARLLTRFAKTDPQTTQPVFYWMNDGVSDTERWAVYGLTRLAEEDLHLAHWIASLPWMTDTITRVEQLALLHLLQLARADSALAKQVTALPWVGDDLTGDERWALSGLSRLAGSDLTLAQRVAAFPWVGDGITDRESKAIRALGSTEPEKARALLDRIGDDSSDQAMMLLSVLFRLQHIHDGLLYDDLLQFHFVRSATVSLPLAGEVDLWVFWPAPLLPHEDVLLVLEETLRMTEDLMRVPFPAPEVVALVPLQKHNFESAAHWGDFIVVPRTERSFAWGSLYHEVAHYYLGGEMGPPWLVEGGAEFVADYIWALRTEREYPTHARPLAEERVRWFCDSQGIDTLQQLNERQQDPDFETICHYSLGSYFLLNLYEVLGEEVMGTTLGELHLLRESLGRQVTEEETYHAFLRNTPPDLVDAFHEVYDRIHGGPRPD